MSAPAARGRSFLEHGVVDVVTGHGEMQLVTRIYLCGDIVRWVGAGVLELTEDERTQVVAEHFRAVDAVAPASKVAKLVALLSRVERIRSGLWLLAGLGASLAPLQLVLWADSTHGWTAWGRLLSPFAMLVLPAFRHLIQRVLRRWLVRTVGDAWAGLAFAE